MTSIPHVHPETLLERFESARNVADHDARASALREIVDACPCFLPASILLSRAIILGKDDPNEPIEKTWVEVERTLRAAVVASRRAPEALSELAHFIYLTDESRLIEAERLFGEAAEKLLGSLEDALATRIEVLATDERLKEADECAALATRMFPTSVRVAEALRTLELYRPQEK